MSASAIEAWAGERGLAFSTAESRELTPALLRGRSGSISDAAIGPLSPGLEGSLFHHVYAGAGQRETTIVLSSVAEGAAFLPALVCRDRAESGDGVPAQLPAERWQGTELESPAFNRRYRLLTLAGQDPLYVRELFSPALIAWLAEAVPPGFFFELNQGHLVVGLPGHLEGEDLDRLCELAAEVARRLREEALEEGEGTGLFDESGRRAALAGALGEARFEVPPPSAQTGLAAYRRAAAWQPFVLLSATLWGAGALLLVGAAVALLSDPVVGLVAGAVAGAGAFGLARRIAAGRYRWGTASVSQLGLEAFVRGYAESRSLRLQDRQRFHARHRTLPLPGMADYVLAGPIPEAGLDGWFLALADDAELRATGTEVAGFGTRHPLAALALVADLGDPDRIAKLRELDLPAGFGLERDGTTVAIWRPVAGNLSFDSELFDAFRAKAGALLAGAPASESRIGERG